MPRINVEAKFPFRASPNVPKIHKQYFSKAMLLESGTIMYAVDHIKSSVCYRITHRADSLLNLTQKVSIHCWKSQRAGDMSGNIYVYIYYIFVLGGLYQSMIT